MLKRLSLFAFIFLIILASAFVIQKSSGQEQNSGAPPFGESEDQVPDTLGVDWITNWKRPEGPPKVGIQAGHWKNNEFPEELKKLRGNSGATGGGKSEWEVNLRISQLIKENLEKEGVLVEILPATVPPRYWADVFLSVHADGSTDRSKSGYKFAGSWRDMSNKADKLVTLLENEYEKETKLERDPNITRNMRGYYAFSWWRYDHAVHPMTTSVIAETGFLTNPHDQKLIINNPEVSAKAISAGILEFLKSEGLLSKT